MVQSGETTVLPSETFSKKCTTVDRMTPLSHNLKWVFKLERTLRVYLISFELNLESRRCG